MVNINANTLVSNNHAQSGSVSAASPSVTFYESKVDATTSTHNSDTATVSILARQLSDAATRAETRVGHKSAELLEPITDGKYFANKAQHDAEIPDTTSEELLTRARQATGFVNGSNSNPFNGLTRDQLNLIAHDDGGPFTINERRAAWETMQPKGAPAGSSLKVVPVDGHEILISRVFGGSEPPVALPPATIFNTLQSASEFLNRDDRALIADMYAYAQAEGADLQYVDRLMRALATYRNYSDGRQLGSSNTGSYDSDGYKVTYDFKPEGGEVASRILNSSAMSSTRIDQGFLRYALDPGHGTFMNVGGIPFLERMVNKFSNEGADQPPLGSEFSTFQHAVIDEHVIRTTHKDIRLAPSMALRVITNGVWSLTELGRAEGYMLEPSTGRLIKPAAPSDDQAPQSLAREAVMDFSADRRDPPGTRWLMPGNLFKLMRNFMS